MILTSNLIKIIDYRLLIRILQFIVVQKILKHVSGIIAQTTPPSRYSFLKENTIETRIIYLSAKGRGVSITKCFCYTCRLIAVLPTSIISMTLIVSSKEKVCFRALRDNDHGVLNQSLDCKLSSSLLLIAHRSTNQALILKQLIFSSFNCAKII